MADPALVQRPLPIGAVGRGSLGWWALLILLMSEGAFLTYTLFTYFYYSTQLWGNMAPPDKPELKYALAMVGVMVVNAIAMWWATQCAKRDSRWLLTLALAVSFLLGLSFIGLEARDWYIKPFSVRTNAYSSAYYLLTGVHLAHVVFGVIMLFFVTVWAAMGYIDSRRNVAVLVSSAYWYFVDAVWIIYFLSAYAAPYFR